MTYYAAMLTSEPEEGVRAPRQAEVLDLLAVAVSLVLLVLALTERVGASRTLFAFAFAFFVPGRAIVSNWQRLADWADIAMSIALSIATLTVAALVSLWLRFWHPLGLFQLEAALSLVGLGVAIARRRRGIVIGERPRTLARYRRTAGDDEHQQS